MDIHSFTSAINALYFLFLTCNVSLDFIYMAIMVTIAMTVFLRTEMHCDSIQHGGIFAGALFFALTMIMFNVMVEAAITIDRLPVFYKQRDYLFYPSWTYVIPSWIIGILSTILKVVVWVFLTYYVIGFDPNIGR